VAPGGGEGRDTSRAGRCGRVRGGIPRCAGAIGSAWHVRGHPRRETRGRTPPPRGRGGSGATADRGPPGPTHPLPESREANDKPPLHGACSSCPRARMARCDEPSGCSRVSRCPLVAGPPGPRFPARAITGTLKSRWAAPQARRRGGGCGVFRDGRGGQPGPTSWTRQRAGRGGGPGESGPRGARALSCPGGNARSISPRPANTHHRQVRAGGPRGSPPQPRPRC